MHDEYWGLMRKATACQETTVWQTFSQGDVDPIVALVMIACFLNVSPFATWQTRTNRCQSSELVFIFTAACEKESKNRLLRSFHE